MKAVRAPELFEPKTRPSKHDAFLRAHIGIDPAILASDLGVSERFVRQRQRKLGLRKCCNKVDTSKGANKHAKTHSR